jgi:hypothetical protein
MNIWQADLVPALRLRLAAGTTAGGDRPAGTCPAAHRGLRCRSSDGTPDEIRVPLSILISPPLFGIIGLGSKDE